MLQMVKQVASDDVMKAKHDSMSRTTRHELYKLAKDRRAACAQVIRDGQHWFLLTDDTRVYVGCDRKFKNSTH